MSRNQGRVPSDPAALRAAARKASELLNMLYQGAYSYEAALAVSKQAYASLRDKSVPLVVDKVRRQDGSTHDYDFNYYLRETQDKPELAAAIQRAWLAGALLAAGDELEQFDYFGSKYPSLEMIYHLRNGVAHGNKFNITGSGEKYLAKCPAHTRDSVARGSVVYEITPNLNGLTVLFDFMGVADIVDVLQSAHWVSARIADGQTSP